VALGLGGAAAAVAMAIVAAPAVAKVNVALAIRAEMSGEAAADGGSSAALQASARRGEEQAGLVCDVTATSGASGAGVHWPRQDGGGVRVAELALASAVGVATASAVAVVVTAEVPIEAAEHDCSLAAARQASAKRGAERAELVDGNTAASKVLRPGAHFVREDESWVEVAAVAVALAGAAAAGEVAAEVSIEIAEHDCSLGAPQTSAKRGVERAGLDNGSAAASKVSNLGAQCARQDERGTLVSVVDLAGAALAAAVAEAPGGMAAEATAKRVAEQAELADGSVVAPKISRSEAPCARQDEAGGVLATADLAGAVAAAPVAGVLAEVAAAVTTAVAAASAPLGVPSYWGQMTKNQKNNWRKRYKKAY
jgi:hypothetical protein